MDKHITIAKRFCGPPDSGNGGYVCGLLARFLDGVVEVRLRKPPPLETPMNIVRGENSRISLMHGDTLIAEAGRARLDIEVPRPPAFREARDAMKNYPGPEEHFFPTCFVCGPLRQEKDGLRIFPGAIAGTRMVASAWVPDETLADSLGLVSPEFIWASLDCPGAFAVLDAVIRPVVLGSLTAEIIERPAAGRKCIAAGWKIASQGRKLFAGTALFSEEGQVLARARAVWFAV